MLSTPRRQHRSAVVGRCRIAAAQSDRADMETRMRRWRRVLAVDADAPRITAAGVLAMRGSSVSPMHADHPGLLPSVRSRKQEEQEQEQ